MKFVSSIALVLLAASAATAQNIVTVATNAGLTTLLQLVTLADLAGPLTDGAANLTVLAPTNAAFTSLGTKVVSTLTQTYNKDWLTQILLYHVFADRYPSSVVLSLAGGNTPPTLQGSTIPVTFTSPNLFLGPARVVTADVTFFNGARRSVVHVIDKVLVPPSITIPGTIVDAVVALNSGGQFTLLFRALTEYGTEFTDLLSSFTEKGFTVFAPTDAAFRKLPARFRKFPLNPKCRQTLKRILKYHVVTKSFLAAQLKDNQKLRTAFAGETIDVDKKMGKVFLDGDVRVVTADLRQANGVIHVINEVLMP